VLLDNCVPRPFRKRLGGHEVLHATDEKWETLTNGELLRALATAGYDAMVTVDRNLAHQQNTGELPVAVIVVAVVRNTDDAMAEFVPAIMAILSQAIQRRVYVLGDIGH
jgi:hypothetical protein